MNIFKRQSKAQKGTRDIFGASSSLGFVRQEDFTALSAALEQIGCTKPHVSGYYNLENECFRGHADELAGIDGSNVLLQPFMDIAKKWFSVTTCIYVDYRRLILEPEDVTVSRAAFWHVDYHGESHRAVVVSDNLPTLLFEEYEPGYDGLRGSYHYPKDAQIQAAVARGLGRVSTAQKLEAIGLDETVLHSQQLNHTDRPIRRNFLRLVVKGC